MEVKLVQLLKPTNVESLVNLPGIRINHHRARAKQHKHKLLLLLLLLKVVVRHALLTRRENACHVYFHFPIGQFATH